MPKLKAVCTPEEIRDKKTVKDMKMFFFNVQKDFKNKDRMEFL